MRVDSKHSPAAHCDFACGRSGLSCNGGGSNTSQAPRCTECGAASMRVSRCALCTYLHTGICGAERDRGGCRVGWVVGSFGSIPAWVQCTPRGRPSSTTSSVAVTSLTRSSSLNPFSRIVDFAFSFIYLSLTFLLGSFVASCLLHPLSLAEYVFFCLSLLRLLLSSSELVNRQTSRNEEK